MQGDDTATPNEIDAAAVPDAGAVPAAPAAPDAGAVPAAPDVVDAANDLVPAVGPKPEPPRLRPWHLAVLAMALFALFRFALPAPRVLTADEVDALRGGHHLVDLMTTVEHDPRLPSPSRKARLKAGFETTPTNPRLAGLPEGSARRAAIEAPLPRWLAALGIGVLPTSAEASNLERARTSSALALALACALLVWTMRRRGAVFGAALILGVFGLPGLWDAAASAGHGASAVFASALLFASLERLLARERGAIWVGVALGLCLGLHPMALSLVVVVFTAWAIAKRPTLAPPAGRPGLMRLPSAPLGLFLVPIVALVVLVLAWPALWAETGKRLGAWLLDHGSLQSPPHDVGGLLFDQASQAAGQGGGRAAQAWTGLVQWVAWTPLPILALWFVGFVRALRAGRDGLWGPILAVSTLLVAAGFDGGLFGARLSLLPLLWVPTLLTAADGAVAALAFARGRAPRLLPERPGVFAALTLLVLFALPLYQAARGTTFGLAHETGAELREPIPTSLLARAAEVSPNATVHAWPRPASLRPALEAAREDLELDLSWGTLDEAELVIVLGAPPPELAPRLVEELARDARPGLVATLWRLDVPAALDKRPNLPH